MLSALIRFNLRVLLNPPPLTSSVPSVCAVERTPASHSKVVNHHVWESNRTSYAVSGVSSSVDG